MSAALDQFAVQEAPSSPVTWPKASRGARFFAYLIDAVFYSALSGFGLALITKGLRVETEGVKLLWSVTSWLVYWSLPTFASGQTLGKRVMKIRVVGLDGSEDIPMRAAIMRETLYKFVSSLVFCLGYVRILTHPDGRAWHDSFAKTRVVSTVEE